MFTIGLDVGIYSTKVTLLQEGEVLANVALPAGLESAESTAKEAVEQAMQVSNISKIRNPLYMVATGQGKLFVPFVDETIADALCLAQGIHKILPSVHTVLDLGVQKSLVVKCFDGYPRGMVISDKCASGSGSYLQVAADVLGLSVDTMGTIALKSTEKIEIDSMCAVFVESEIISLLHSKTKTEDILGAIYRCLAARLHSLLLRIGIEGDLALVGGIAKDIGLCRAIKEQVGHHILVPKEPLFIGSLGAAIIGQIKCRRDV